MAFDWFRRRFTEQNEPEAGLEKPTEAAGQSAPTPSATPNPSPPETTPEDYLAFAKAAYANLKARETSQAAPARQFPPEVPTPSQTVETAEPTPTPSEIKRESPAPPVSIPEGSSQPATPAAEEIPAVHASGTESVSAPVQSVAAPSFFDLAPRAVKRLEALEASAIAEPEPVAATLSSPAEAPSEELVFDEGFRWSAEILAAQGRRPEEISAEEISWLQKLRQGLGKTRLNLINQLKALVGRGPIDQDAVEEIEMVLLQADVGIDATERIIQALQKRMREEVLPPEEAVKYLKQQMRQMLSVGDPTFAPQRDHLNVWLIVGVNGAGKTTTIGKIAHVAQGSGYKCLIAAADTFRAAAVEQLKVWGERAGVEVIANPGQNTDPAAVVFDAVTAAQARGTELLLVDTAGRLQNKKNLMDELAKIRRIIDKKAPEATVEGLLVLDATQGQNGLRQAQVFAEAAKLSGVILTKLDSTAKGGIALAITQQMHLPIRFIGAGEGLEDLRPFSSYEFVEALLSEY
ncbi:signal recognition particle-docking protein FtsY [Synechococcus sp. Nb3U1]|uniref:signal recognition particle-docking protein FtsY n=1 Tax=Synechococcus sp. Nb3U1 TaxID=1914529 RepID=UPI001F402EF6|nr:signal recognition particle-docking protein FtsY [Synechococcus sp. Nb3U1]MCF2970051.1 signal recognition particle-docking protein FtsY [Synechococcus sp. Nb3U1]